MNIKLEPVVTMSDEHPTEHRTGHEHEPALNKLFRAAVKTKDNHRNYASLGN